MAANMAVSVYTRLNYYAAREFWAFRLLNQCFACFIRVSCVYALEF